MTPSFMLLLVVSMFGLVIGLALKAPVLGIVLSFACWVAAILALGSDD